MEQIFPIVKALKNYSKATFKYDLSAGLTVGVMLIPQGMAYAMIAGLPPVYGLYTAIFPTLMYVLFGTSRHASVGPVAMDSLILIAGVSAFATVGTEGYLLIVFAMTATVGLIQLLMGILRLGFLANFLSKPVIYGFTFAAAVLISVKQIKYLFGFSSDISLGWFKEFVFMVSNLDRLHYPTLIAAGCSILILALGKRLLPRIPFSLVVVLLGTLLSYALDANQWGISLVGSLPSGLPDFALPVVPDVSPGRFMSLAFTLALMGFVEVYAIGQRLQARHKGEYEIYANRELIGIGMGNLVGSFFSTFPATGGFSRSAVNEASGARTGLASVFSAITVIFTLLFLMPVFRFLPHAVLGAIIFVAVLGLVDFKIIKFLWRNDKYDLVMLLTSFMGTLVFGFELGIGLGIMVSLLVMIYKTSSPHMAVLGQVAGTTYFRNLDRFKTAQEDPEIRILRFDARLYFANIDALKTKIETLVASKPDTKKFVLDAQSISDIDSTGLQGLEDIINSLNEQGISFHMASVIGPVRDKLYRSGLSTKIGLSNIHDCVEDALYEKKPDARLTYQTNVRD